MIDRRTWLGGAIGLSLTSQLRGAIPVHQRRTIFGVNCFDLFYRSANGRGFTDPYPILKPLADHGIKFVRFNGGFFWPNDWRKFDQDPAHFTGLMDQVVEAAERADVGLVPSIIWFPAGVSDYVGEAQSAWGDPASHTWTFAEQYIRNLVSRYKGSAAIWMWEFGNEFNAFADFVGSERYFPPVNVKFGTPAKRTAADRLTSREVQTAFGHFAEIVRSLDGTRPISSGAHFPRARMMNDARGIGAPDTPVQLRDALKLSLSGETDMLSVHLYQESLKGRFAQQGTNFSQLLSVVRAAADAKGAGMFVGEFGLPSNAQDHSPAVLHDMIAAIQANRADYAALWNYDYWPDDPYTVSFTSDRAWQLAALGKANL